MNKTKSKRLPEGTKILGVLGIKDIKIIKYSIKIMIV